jgi:hypothetical protein
MEGTDILDHRPPLEPRRVVFGLVFAGFGGLGPAVGIVLSGDLQAWPSALVGLVFLAAGLAVGFGRKGVMIDRAEGTVTTWWGVFVPFSKKHLDLGEPGWIELGREVRGSGKSRTVVYPVALVEDGDAASQELLAPQSYEEGRRAAESMASFLEIAMHDTSTGERVVREAGTLDESLRDRLMREQGSVPAPSSTPPGRLRAARDGDRVSCVLPPGGVRMQNLVGLVMVIIIPVFVLRQFWFDDDMPLPVRGFFLLFMAIPALFVLPPLVRSLLGRDRVEVSQSELVVRRWGAPWGGKRIPTEQLEELTVVGQGASVPSFFTSRASGSVVARSDQLTLVMGQGLSPEEAQWLHDTICFELVPTAFGYRDKPGAKRPG